MEGRVVTESTLDEVLQLLRVSKLPYQDIRIGSNLFVSYHDDGKLIGLGGLEFYSKYALLRSVAVSEWLRGKSTGTKIVSDLLSRARENGIIEVYLLTETAHDFFIKRGFSDVAREDVPAEVRASTEFSSVCPTSASVMFYRFA